MRSASLRIRSGFTLLEMLVAMGVFALLVVLLASMVGNVSSAWTRSREKMDADAKGRALMNVLQKDLRDAAIREDLPAFPSGEFSFYTTTEAHDEAMLASGSAAARSLTFVSYSKADDADAKPALFRSDRPYFYRISGGSDAPLWVAPSVNNAKPTAGTFLSRRLCEGVYAFRFAFVQKDGSVSQTFHKATGNPTCAVQVSLAVLGDQAEMLLQQMDLRPELEEIFDKVGDPAAGQAWSPKTRWDDLLLSDPGMEAFPAQIRSGIRTYERVIPVQPAASGTGA
jgi:prepilin-type N-terminal cleavage/methylation domain-containing protein